MLYPKSNEYRQARELNGIWEFRMDPSQTGVNEGWANGFEGGRPIAVPASWNEQFEDAQDFFGDGWYQTSFCLPWSWEQQRVLVRFGSANYLAEAWLNGSKLGEHEGPGLPFEFDATSFIKRGENKLVVRVDATLSEYRVPPGKVTYHPDDTYAHPSYPDSNFNTYPYCGIDQPVFIYTRPNGALKDVFVRTDIMGADGIIEVSVTRDAASAAEVRIILNGFGAEYSAEAEGVGQEGKLALRVPHATLWSPQAPNLYELTIELRTGLGIFDKYTLPIGVRNIKIEGDQILLNGEPLSIKGFGLAADFATVGRGPLDAALVHDFSVMRWMGANCIRSYGLPASEALLDMADRLGFVVIDESPLAGFAYGGPGLEKRYLRAREVIKEFGTAHRNHPSVIMYSLVTEGFSRRGAARVAQKRFADDLRSVDDSRLLTTISETGLLETAFSDLDVVCLNYRPGWDTHPGQLKDGLTEFATGLDALYEKFAKPIIVTQFACPAIPGNHAMPSEMFSEEYQAEELAGAIKIMQGKEFVVGQITGALCDYKATQSITSPASTDYRGLFTRDRKPKLAVHSLRSMWRR